MPVQKLPPFGSLPLDYSKVPTPAPTAYSGWETPYPTWNFDFEWDHSYPPTREIDGYHYDNDDVMGNDAPTEMRAGAKVPFIYFVPGMLIGVVFAILRKCRRCPAAAVAPQRSENPQPTQETNNDELVSPETLRKIEIEDMLITKRVVIAPVAMALPADLTVSKSFRSTHPKEDIVVSDTTMKSYKGLELYPASGAAELETSLDVDTNELTKSVRLCSICMDEYKVGQEIGWSRNPHCYHAFHKHCISEWLLKNADCPVCRSPYLSDIELG